LSAFDVIALYSLIFSIAGLTSSSITILNGLSNYRWKMLRYIYSGIICDEMAGCLWFRSIVFFYSTSLVNKLHLLTSWI
jgi:hypothetical protein